MEQERKDFQNISDSCSHFSSDFFQALTSEQNQDNVVCSSMSAHIILALLFHGADGVTKDELKTGLHLSDSNQLQRDVKYLFELLNHVPKAELKIANAMYVDYDFVLLERFLAISAESFQTYIEKIDSKNGAGSAEQINKWIKEKTNEKIVNIIGSDDINEYTKLILVNALYFKSSWINPFESQHTENKIFYNINNVETYVPTMYKTFHLPAGYIESLKANFIKINYVSEDFEMIVILPNERYGLLELERNFKWDLISKAACFTKEVELSLPKFRIEKTLDLKTTLKMLGINLMFEEQANFGRLATQPLYVDKVIQKIFIEVDEKGSEAAVATVARVRTRRMIVDTEIFAVDHPFMFIIHHKPSSIPLFIGSIRKLDGTLRKDEL